MSQHRFSLPYVYTIVFTEEEWTAKKTEIKQSLRKCATTTKNGCIKGLKATATSVNGLAERIEHPPVKDPNAPKGVSRWSALKYAFGLRKSVE